MSMIRICAAVVVLATAAAPAAAQTAPGKPGRGAGAAAQSGGDQTIRGELTRSDRRLDDDSFYDCHPVSLTGGRSYTFRMESSAFDAYLALSEGTTCDGNIVDSDDDGAGGTDSQIQFTAPSSGRWSLRANSLTADQTGAYVLRISAGGGGGPAPAPAARAGTLRLGETVEGRLEAGDAEAGDGSYFDCWRLEGLTGGVVNIILQSDDFDAFLSVYANGTCSGENVGSDDDGAGGTNAGLSGALDRNGTYSVRANSLSAGETGQYTLLAFGDE